MSRRMCTGVVVLLFSGCFSDPPGQGSGAETGGSTSSAASTGSPSTSNPGESSGDSTSSSTSTTDSAGSSSSTGAPGTTSSGEDTGTSTGSNPGCMPSEVQVGALCLEPLVVEGIDTQLQPPAPAAFAGAPCLPAACPDGLALGGGFLLEGVLVHASHRDENTETWLACGDEEPEVSPHTRQSFAQCALGSGDVVVNTETYAINGNEGLTCFDADCPPGTTLVGGGGRWGPNFGVQGSEPTIDGSRWEVCGSGTGAMAMVEVDAHCAVLAAGTGTQVYEEVRLVAPGESGCASASCNGDLPLAGGVSTGISMIATGSHPDGDEWIACGRSDGNFNVQVRARVLCLEN